VKEGVVKIRLLMRCLERLKQLLYFASIWEFKILVLKLFQRHFSQTPSIPLSCPEDFL
jgi:hypothetical protein